eukprot:jgi/Bigna1/126732/aug1.3_g1440
MPATILNIAQIAPLNGERKDPTRENMMNVDARVEIIGKYWVIKHWVLDCKLLQSRTFPTFHPEVRWEKVGLKLVVEVPKSVSQLPSPQLIERRIDFKHYDIAATIIGVATHDHPLEGWIIFGEECEDEGCFGYLLGKGGETKEFLEDFSGARLYFSKSQQLLTIRGPEQAVGRAKLAISIMLKQKTNRYAGKSFGGIANRPDSVVLTLTDTEYSAVMGGRGGMLRRIQQEALVFIFFDSLETNTKGPRSL